MLSPTAPVGKSILWPIAPVSERMLLSPAQVSKRMLLSLKGVLPFKYYLYYGQNDTPGTGQALAPKGILLFSIK